MATRSCKHARRDSAPDSERAAVQFRAVQIPPRVTKLVRENDAVVLGAREPSEGRYSTIVRQNYLGRGAGVAPVRGERNLEMNSKHFSFGAEHQHVPILSESHGAQQSAVTLGNQERSQLPPITPSLTSQPRSHSTTPKADIRAHMERMRSSSVFEGRLMEAAAAQPSCPTSTQRGSYAMHDASTVSQQREEAAKLRRMQTQTSWCGGHEPSSEWKSVKESTMTGVAAEPAKLSTQNLTTCVNVGSPSVTASERLKTLKQVDFVPHRSSPTPPPAFSAHEDHLALGYRKRELTTTSRVSYTPTRFV